MSLSVEKNLRKAQSHLKAGEFAEAETLYKAILLKFPKNKKAIEGYQRVNSGVTAHKSPSFEPPQDQIQALLRFYHNRQFQDLFANAENLARQYPNSVLIYNILGMANASLQNSEAAIWNFQQAINAKPDYAESHYNLGISLQTIGKIDAAISSFQRAIKIKPDHFASYNNMGNALKSKGTLSNAIDCFKNVLEIKPDYTEAHYNLGVALQENGDLDEAITCYQRTLEIQPTHSDAYNNLGNALKDKGAWNAAIENYKNSLKIKPGYAEAHCNMGLALKGKGDLDAAIQSYCNALKIKPDYAEAHRNLSLAKTYAPNDTQIADMDALYESELTSDEQRCHLCFALAKAHRDLKNLKRSFIYLKEGNALRKKLLSYDISKDEKLFAEIKNRQPLNLNGVPDSLDGTCEVTPIFILGMPRSGTTLVEQIISSHSQVTGAGELEFVRRLADELHGSNSQVFRDIYLKKLGQLSLGNGFVTDKMPHNFLHIDQICRSLPEAKIIHIKRDPAAICWSNYQHYFASRELAYSCDLEDLVKYYRMYDDLMTFWYAHYGDRIYQLDYDQLTVKQEDETIKLIDHIGLDWESVCLSPHKNKRGVHTASQQQVRKEVYTGSSSQWRKFEPFLGGVFDGLSGPSTRSLET